MQLTICPVSPHLTLLNPAPPIPIHNTNLILMDITQLILPTSLFIASHHHTTVPLAKQTPPLPTVQTPPNPTRMPLTKQARPPIVHHLPNDLITVIKRAFMHLTQRPTTPHPLHFTPSHPTPMLMTIPPLRPQLLPPTSRLCTPLFQMLFTENLEFPICPCLTCPLTPRNATPDMLATPPRANSLERTIPHFASVSLAETTMRLEIWLGGAL